MKLIFINKTDAKLKKALFQALLGRAKTVLGIPKNYQYLDLAIYDSTEMRELNKRYRGKDYATDVLSFPDSSETLGQIVICLETAQAQATELGQSLEEELKFLFTHGLLHLLGYDHENPTDEAVMLREAYRILERNKSD